jgi:hypothetical protein
LQITLLAVIVISFVNGLGNALRTLVIDEVSEIPVADKSNTV